MLATAKKSTFSDRLRDYSRAVGAKLEIKREAAGRAAAITAAAGATLTAHQAAEAAIVYSGPVNLNVTAFGSYSNPTATFDIDGLANFGVSAAWLGFYSYFNIRQVGFGTTGSVNSTAAPGPSGEQIVFAPGAGGNDQPDRLAGGDTIGPASPWFAPAINAGNNNKALVAGNNYNASFAGNNWPNPGTYGATATGYAGVRFDTAGGSDKHYGWVRLQLTTDAFTRVTSVTVLDWAYESTPGAAIAAGAVPEPTAATLGGLGALALGASSVRRIRRERGAQAA